MSDNSVIDSTFVMSSLQQTSQLLSFMQKDQALISNLHQAIDAVCNCMQSKNKVLFVGNGGSAADAQHMSAEFVCRFMMERQGLPSIALTTDTSALTAIGNDYGFDQIFARQIQALGQAGDVLIAYSTSGASPNILKGLEMARERQITTIGFTGTKEQSHVMAAFSDIMLRIPSNQTSQIQEGHLVVGHILCGAVERKLFSEVEV